MSLGAVLKKRIVLLCYFDLDGCSILLYIGCLIYNSVPCNSLLLISPSPFILNNKKVSSILAKEEESYADCDA
jgi:hypothetical protein